MGPWLYAKELAKGRIERSKSMTCKLYRHYNDSGELLYVGVSLNAIQRLTQHNESSSWADDIAHIDIETFPDKEIALKYEKWAIQHEEPLHNIKHKRKSPYPYLAMEYKGMNLRQISDNVWLDPGKNVIESIDEDGSLVYGETTEGNGLLIKTKSGTFLQINEI